MSNWNYKLDLSDLKFGELGESNLGEISKKVAERIRNAPFYEELKKERTIEYIAENFECCDESTEAREFNLYLNDLYLFGDKHRIWVATSFSGTSDPSFQVAVAAKYRAQ